MENPVSSRAHAFLCACVVGMAVFAAASISDLLIRQQQHNIWLSLFDDFVVAAFAAGLILYYEWRRDVEMRRKLSAVVEVNHCVRNQLEIMEYSAWTTHDRAHMTRMREAVCRIDRALREVLGNGVVPPLLPPAKPPCRAVQAPQVRRAAP